MKQIGTFLLFMALIPFPIHADQLNPTNVQLLVELNKIIRKAGRTGKINPTNPIVAATTSRQLFSVRELTNIRIQRIQRGLSAAHAIAAFGMPTHLQSFGAGQAKIDVLYFYRNRGFAYQRQIVVLQTGMVVGVTQLINTGRGHKWSGSGILPRAAWKLEIPREKTILPPTHPPSVVRCRKPSMRPCHGLVIR